MSAQPPGASQEEQSLGPASEPQPSDSNLGNLIGTIIAVPLFAALVGVMLAIPAAFAYAIYEAFPRHEVIQKRNPGWIDLIFENRYVVFSARIVLLALALVLLFGGVYLAASIGVRMYRKEWLRRAGPFEADVAARVEEELGAVDEQTFALLQDAWGQNEELGTRLENALQELESVTEERDALVSGHHPSGPAE